MTRAELDHRQVINMLITAARFCVQAHLVRGLLAACLLVAPASAAGTLADVKVRLVVECPEKISPDVFRNPEDGKPVCIAPGSVLGGSDFIGARRVTDALGPTLILHLRAPAAKRFALFTEKYRLRTMALIVDDKIRSMVRMNEQFGASYFQVSRSMTAAEMDSLIALIGPDK